MTCRMLRVVSNTVRARADVARAPVIVVSAQSRRVTARERTSLARRDAAAVRSCGVGSST
jgi:hypothetical protein